MKKSYLYIGARQYGPFSRAELKKHHIHRDTAVWYEGLNEWVKAGTVEELQEILPASCPPPFLESNEGSPPSASGPFSRKSSRLQQRFFNRLSFIISLIVLGLLILTLLVTCC